MIWMFLILACIIIAILCFMGASSINKNQKNITEKRKEKVEELIKEKEMNVDKRFDTDLSHTVLIHDMKKQCFWYIRHLNNEKEELKKITYNDIVQVELKEDDESLIVTARTSQLGGAIVGGVLAGGVGAVIGGLGGQQKQKRTVRNIQLLMTIDDLQNPLLKINFAFFHKPIQTNMRQYIIKHEEALNWFKLMEVIVKRSENKQH